MGTYQTQAGTVHASNDNSTWTSLKSWTNNEHTASAWWDIDLSSNTGHYKYYKITVTAKSSYILWIECRITATYLTSVANSITYPQSFTTTNYAYSLAYLNGVFGESYATSKTATGLSLQNNSNATNVYYTAIGY